MNCPEVICIHGGTIFTPVNRIENGVIVIEDGYIQSVGLPEQVTCPKNACMVDARGLSIAPGFIDLQCNGAFGHDFRTDPSSIWKAAEELPCFGVTAFLPTIPTSPLEYIAAAQAQFTAGSRPTRQGATPLGLHIEGPFLNPIKKGAHNPAYLRSPDLALASDWAPDTGIRLVTLAPELPGALDMVSLLKMNGVVVSAGHSMASFEEAKAAIDAGVTYGTHLFNAMHPLNHREPGLIGALVSDERCTFGLIADGIHLHPIMIKLIDSTKDKITLVTDAMAALGMQPGKYHFIDREVTVSQQDARLADGILAGSVLSLDQALRNTIKFTGCSLIHALKMTTLTPASVLGMQNQRGQIRPGLVADLVIFSPELEIVATYVSGEIAYQNGSFPP